MPSFVDKGRVVTKHITDLQGQAATATVNIIQSLLMQQL